MSGFVSVSRAVERRVAVVVGVVWIDDDGWLTAAQQMLVGAGKGLRRSCWLW